MREAHRHAVTVALQELERYTQARMGGNNAAETTGKFVAAKFEHDTARPVDGYAAPQLHTHAVIFNMTEREDGSTRALQARSLFDTQQFATAIYQSELTFQLRNLGYEIEARTQRRTRRSRATPRSTSKPRAHARSRSASTSRRMVSKDRRRRRSPRTAPATARRSIPQARLWPRTARLRPSMVTRQLPSSPKRRSGNDPSRSTACSKFRAGRRRP